MSSVSRKLSQVRARENYFVVAISGSYGYYPECIDIGLADAKAEGYKPSRVGDNITATEFDDLLETYLITYAVEGTNEELATGTVLKDLGKTITWVAGNGEVIVTWRLVQRMRNVTGEGATMFPNDVFYVPTFYSDHDVFEENVGVARVG